MAAQSVKAPRAAKSGNRAAIALVVANSAFFAGAASFFPANCAFFVANSAIVATSIARDGRVIAKRRAKKP